MFLDEEGMELFLDVLNTFPGEAAIETKILGLLNNIAEVNYMWCGIGKLLKKSILRSSGCGLPCSWILLLIVSESCSTQRALRLKLPLHDDGTKANNVFRNVVREKNGIMWEKFPN